MELGRARPGRDGLPAEGSSVFDLPAPSGLRLEHGLFVIFGAVLASPIGSQRCDLPSDEPRLGKGRWVAARSPRKSAGPGRVVELFAGVGGFRVALERSGWQTVW